MMMEKADLDFLTRRRQSAHELSSKLRRPCLVLIVLIGCYCIASILLQAIVARAEGTRWLDLIQDSSTPPSNPFGPAKPDLRWIPCGERIQCATLSVPLDHLNLRDKRSASIAINRYLATKQPPDGTIIYNPGGPGGSGTGATYRVGPKLDKILQGRYDVVGFDPRGINQTLPRVTCLKSLEARVSLQQILGSTAPSLNLHDVGVWDAFGQLIAEACEENSGVDVLPFVNTPTVARDIAAIVDALRTEKVHHVSYWGFSYGTNLGAIFAAMFPNKLHRIILDGIRSPFDAREIYEWGYTSVASQDDVMEGYFNICDKVGKARCPLAGFERGAGKTIMDLLTSLYDRPLPVSAGNFAGLVTYYDYKSFFYETLYRPESWPKFASITLDLLHGNGSSFLQTTRANISRFGTPESGTAVLCTDSEPATNYTLESWTEFAANMTKISFIAGDSRSLDTIPCRHWYSTPNERWLGTFNDVELQTPVLMIGNTYDPATPLDSAKRLAGRMGRNAILLEQRSYGHCSTSAVSHCTHKIALDYLLEGVLPEQGTVCEVDDEDFGDYFPKLDEPDQITSSYSSLRDTMKVIMDEILL